MTRRRLIPQRKVIFVGCEGESEVGYAGLLQDLAHAASLHIHIQPENLAPAGDPLARVERAVKRLEHIARTKGAVRDRYLLLDADQVALNAQRAQQARQLAAQHSINLVWQDPAIEAVLLRHLEGLSAHRPPTTAAAEQAIKAAWPQYEKPMSRAELAKRIDLAGVLRAAGVEPDLTLLLRCIGFVE